MKLRWWLLGGAGLYGGYKVLTVRQQLIDVSEEQIAAKITHHRDLAKKGNKESLQYLKSLDGLLDRLKSENSSSANQILTSLQFKGLYPASAI